jgi:hypothetical protein
LILHKLAFGLLLNDEYKVKLLSFLHILFIFIVYSILYSPFNLFLVVPVEFRVELHYELHNILHFFLFNTAQHRHDVDYDIHIQGYSPFVKSVDFVIIGIGLQDIRCQVTQDCLYLEIGGGAFIRVVSVCN